MEARSSQEETTSSVCLGRGCSPAGCTPALVTVSAATTHGLTSELVTHMMVGLSHPLKIQSPGWDHQSDHPGLNCLQRYAEKIPDPLVFPGGKLGSLSYHPAIPSEQKMPTNQINFFHSGILPSLSSHPLTILGLYFQTRE